MHLTVLTTSEPPKADCVKVVQKCYCFPNSSLIKKYLVEQEIPASLREKMWAHCNQGFLEGLGGWCGAVELGTTCNQEGHFLQCCRKHTHTSQRQWGKDSVLALCLVASKELHSWPNHRAWQGCQEPCSSRVSLGTSTGLSLFLWVVLHAQSQAREECERESVFTVVVWAAGQPFLLSVALHQGWSSLCVV